MPVGPCITDLMGYNREDKLMMRIGKQQFDVILKKCDSTESNEIGVGIKETSYYIKGRLAAQKHKGNTFCVYFADQFARQLSKKDSIAHHHS